MTEIEAYLSSISEPYDPARVKVLADGDYLLVKRLLFHWTMIRGQLTDTTGYDDRWCYETYDGAKAALDAFPVDPAPNYEPSGWHRHPKTHRRRENADPALEYIDP